MAKAEASGRIMMPDWDFEVIEWRSWHGILASTTSSIYPAPVNNVKTNTYYLVFKVNGGQHPGMKCPCFWEVNDINIG
jgi:hypothetical protein